MNRSSRKKLTTKVPHRLSKSPPPGWPSEEEWVEIEQDLKESLPTRFLPKNAGPVLRAKQELCGHFVHYFRVANITQREFARELGVTESRVSEILHFHHDRFTIDKLLELLARLNPKIRIKVA